MSNNCKFKELLAYFGKMQLKSDYNVKLSLYSDDKSEAPCSSACYNGSSKVNLAKLLAAITATALILSLLSSVIDLFNCKR